MSANLRLIIIELTLISTFNLILRLLQLQVKLLNLLLHQQLLKFKILKKFIKNMGLGYSQAGVFWAG